LTRDVKKFANFLDNFLKRKERDMSKPSKKSLPIQNLEIKIDSDSSIPRVILNGIDFQAEDIGLRGINIFWETKKDEVPETLIQVDYINNREEPHIVSVKQSFQNTLLK
jgi:hypothetical protein